MGAAVATTEGTSATRCTYRHGSSSTWGNPKTLRVRQLLYAGDQHGSCSTWGDPKTLRVRQLLYAGVTPRPHPPTRTASQDEVFAALGACIRVTEDRTALTGLPQLFASSL